MAHQHGSRSKDIEVTDPNGCAYRICTRRRGEPLRPWEGAETGVGPLDLLVFLGSMGQRLVTAARVHSSHGWTVGVLQDVDLRWKVVHREHIEDEALAGRPHRAPDGAAGRVGDGHEWLPSRRRTTRRRSVGEATTS
jgi:hypothetical protein